MHSEDDESRPHGPEKSPSALLGRVREGVSIVDSLMEMPLPDEENSPVRDAEASRQLERRLVDAMRSLLKEDEPERKSA